MIFSVLALPTASNAEPLPELYQATAFWPMSQEGRRFTDGFRRDLLSVVEPH